MCIRDRSKASITAPSDGVVLTRSVDPGNAVAASLQAVTLFTVAEDLARLRLWVYVDEADVGVVKAGQAASFTVSAYPARAFPARITRVGFGSTITDNVDVYKRQVLSCAAPAGGAGAGTSRCEEYRWVRPTNSGSSSAAQASGARHLPWRAAAGAGIAAARTGSKVCADRGARQPGGSR